MCVSVKPLSITPFMPACSAHTSHSEVMDSCYLFMPTSQPTIGRLEQKPGFISQMITFVVSLSYSWLSGMVFCCRPSASTCKELFALRVLCSTSLFFFQILPVGWNKSCLSSDLHHYENIFTLMIAAGLCSLSLSMVVDEHQEFWSVIIQIKCPSNA